MELSNCHTSEPGKTVKSEIRRIDHVLVMQVFYISSRCHRKVYHIWARIVLFAYSIVQCNLRLCEIKIQVQGGISALLRHAEWSMHGTRSEKVLPLVAYR